jgi:predicted ATP-grasp superfamily ATP-dependent carboligase
MMFQMRGRSFNHTFLDHSLVYPGLPGRASSSVRCTKSRPGSGRCLVAEARTIPPDDGLERGLGRLLQMIGWSGLFQAQFVRDAHGEHYLIDLNPRVYGSLNLAVAAGLNLPGIWVDLLLGRRRHVGAYRVGTRFRHEERDVRALAKMLVDGELLGALQGCMPRRGTTHAIFSFRDPTPLLVSVGKLIGRLRSA